jgi:hypothetical protein
MSAFAGVAVGVGVGAVVAVAAAGAVVATGAVVAAAVGAFWLGAAPHAVVNADNTRRTAYRRTLTTLLRAADGPGCFRAKIR